MLPSSLQALRAGLLQEYSGELGFVGSERGQRWLLATGGGNFEELPQLPNGSDDHG
jgi:hypothetical protein